MLKIQIAARDVALTTHSHRATSLQIRWNCTSSPPWGSFDPFKGELYYSRPCKMYSCANSASVTEWKRRVWRHSQTKPFGVLVTLRVIEIVRNRGETGDLGGPLSHTVSYSEVAVLINNTLWSLGDVNSTQECIYKPHSKHTPVLYTVKPA